MTIKFKQYNNNIYEKVTLSSSSTIIYKKTKVTFSQSAPATFKTYKKTFEKLKHVDDNQFIDN